MTFGPFVKRGKCDWCSADAALVEHTLPDGDFVYLCSVCEWLSILQAEIKDANETGKDMA